MNVTAKQLEAIRNEGLDMFSTNPTWAQSDDGYIYANLIEDDHMTLFIFAPSGNRYKERREFSNEGWDIIGWSEEE